MRQIFESLKAVILSWGSWWHKLFTPPCLTDQCAWSHQTCDPYSIERKAKTLFRQSIWEWRRWKGRVGSFYHDISGIEFCNLHSIHRPLLWMFLLCFLEESVKGKRNVSGARKSDCERWKLIESGFECINVTQSERSRWDIPFICSDQEWLVLVRGEILDLLWYSNSKQRLLLNPDAERYDPPWKA